MVTHVWSAVRAVCARCGRSKLEIISLNGGLLSTGVCYGPKMRGNWVLPREPVNVEG